MQIVYDMSNIINDFGTFTTFLFASMGDILHWLLSNPLGEILYFIVVILISMAFIEFIVNLKES